MLSDLKLTLRRNQLMGEPKVVTAPGLYGYQEDLILPGGLLFSIRVLGNYRGHQRGTVYGATFSTPERMFFINVKEAPASTLL